MKWWRICQADEGAPTGDGGAARVSADPAPPADPAEPDPRIAELEARATDAESKLDQALPAVKAVAGVRERIQALRAEDPEKAAMLEAVLYNRELPKPAGAGATTGLPDDLTEDEVRLVSLVNQQNTAALADLLQQELGPIREQLRLAQMRDQVRTLKAAPYADRLPGAQEQLATLLDDPAVVRGGIENAFKQADYDKLHTDHAAALVRIAELEKAGETEADRLARIAKFSRAGGRGAVGAPPKPDDKGKSMREIFLEELTGAKQ